MCDFVTGNVDTIVLIYAIVAVIVWVAVNLYFWKISFDLDREIREEMRNSDCFYYDDEEDFGKWVVRVTGMLISIPAALLWCFTPFILGGLILYDTIEQKKPELFGSMAEKFDEETEEKK